MKIFRYTLVAYSLLSATTAFAGGGDAFAGGLVGGLGGGMIAGAMNRPHSEGYREDKALREENRELRKENRRLERQQVDLESRLQALEDRATEEKPAKRQRLQDEEMMDSAQ